MSRINAAAQADLWLAEHPPEWQFICDTVPAEVPSSLPLVGILLDAANAVGHKAAVAGLDSWHDAATYTRFGVPTVSFGPQGMETAHAVDEHVPVAALADYCCAIALAVMRYSGF